MRGARSRQPDASTRGGVAHLRFFQTTGPKRRKQGPPRAGRGPPPFSFSGTFRVPGRAAGWGWKKGGRGTAAAHCNLGAPHQGGPQPPLCSPSRTASTPSATAQSFSRIPRPLTWVTFPHRLRGEEERPLLNESLVEAVELSVHGGGGERTRVGGHGAAARQGAAKRADGGLLLLDAGWRLGANEAAGRAGPYL